MKRIIVSSLKLKRFNSKFNHSLSKRKIYLKTNKRYCSQFFNEGNKNYKLEREPKILEGFLQKIESQLSENPRDIKQWINKATILNKLKRYNKAIESCNTAISLCTGSDIDMPPNIIRDLFITIMSIKSDSLKSLKSHDTYEKSLKYFDLILTLEPNFAPILIAKAEVLIELRHYTAALKCLDLIERPNPVALRLKGTVLTKLGEFSKAIACFDKSIEINDYLESKICKAECIYSMGDVEKAIEMLQEEFTKYTEPIDKYTIYKTLGNIYIKNKDFKNALKHFEMAKNFNSEEPEIWFLLYRTLSYLNNPNMAKARKGYISYYLKKHEIKERDKDSFLNIANEFYNQKTYNESILWYQESLTLESTFEAYYGLASSLKALDINELALKHFKNALKFHPDDKNCITNIADIYLKLNDIEKGLTLYHSIFEKHPNDETAAIGIINAYIFQRRYEDAINFIDKLLFPLNENIEILSQKALAYTLLNNVKEAMEIYLYLTEKYPSKGKTWMNLSLCLIKLGKKEEALQCSQKAQEISPDDPDIWSQHAILCLLINNYRESWDALNKAEALNQSREFPDLVLTENIERTRSQIENILSSK